jgi:uncharacterized Rossmann fold enzyme
MGFMRNHTKSLGMVKAKRIKSRCLARKLNEVLPSLSWLGQTCFIIGGGPSLEDFDWRLLRGYKTIGINKAFRRFYADLNYSMDYNFFDIVQHQTNPQHVYYETHLDWMKYPGIKVFLRDNTQQVFAEGICYVPSLGSEKEISFDLGKGVYGGNNSGMGALMLAIALGCKRIGLLGYDFKMEDDKTHWHEGYPNQDNINFAKNLVSFRDCVDELAGAIQGLGIEVVNLSPISTLRNFPRSDVKTFILQ